MNACCNTVRVVLLLLFEAFFNNFNFFHCVEIGVCDAKIKLYFGNRERNATFAFFETLFQFQGKCKHELLLNRTPVLQ